MKNNGYTFKYAASLARLDRIVALLKKPMTRHQLAQAAGIGVRGLQAYLSALLAEEPRRIHICDWHRSHPGSPTAVYVAGAGKDKPAPKPLTNAERMRAIRARRDADEALDIIMAQRAARRKPRRDPMVAALFGPA